MATRAFSGQTTEYSLQLADFVGAWTRTKLFEPKDVLTHHEDPSIRLVLWLQTSCGIFVDIRVDLPHVSITSSKSFAGKISYNKELSHITWTREIDYRPLSPPDIGKAQFLSENILKEDSVLEEDDFVEIWERDNISLENQPCTAIELVQKSSSSSSSSSITPIRQGYFVIVGDWFGLSLNRENTNEKEGKESINELSTYFDKPLDSNNNNNIIITQKMLQYITIVGSCSDWKIKYALDPDMVDTYLCGSNEYIHPDLKILFNNDEFKWNVVEGNIPTEFKLKDSNVPIIK